jgi:putative ABC transport system permease protein
VEESGFFGRRGDYAGSGDWREHRPFQHLQRGFAEASSLCRPESYRNALGGNPGTPAMPVAPANFVDWRTQTRSFTEIAAINPFLNFILTGIDTPVRVSGAAVSWNFFRLLGVRMSLGREFLPEEDQPGRNRVAILTHSTWVNHFGSRADILGGTLMLNDVAFTVVVVLSADSEFVGRASNFHAKDRFDVWVPLAISRVNPSRGSHPLRVFARLKPETTMEQAQADLNMVATNLARMYPEDNRDRGIRAVPLYEEVTAELRPALWTFMAAVSCVLLIACANVANLMLSRGASRHREISVRVAIGAGRGRIVQQLLVESVVLAFGGGATGLMLAIAAVRLAMRYLPPDLARAAAISGTPIDARVAVFTGFITLATGILFGLAPLFESRRVSPNDALKQEARIAGDGRSRLRSVLIVGQMAVTLLLLIGAGLLGKSLWALLSVPPGFRTDHMLTATLTLPRSRYPMPEQIAAFQRELIERLNHAPGVQSAGLGAYLPLSGADNGWAFTIEGRPPLPQGVYNVVKYRPVSHAYFETIGMPLLRGRSFSATDSRNAPFVVVINAAMAREYWGGENPVGQRLRFASAEWRTIIGVVGDVRHEGLDRDLKPEMYVTFAQAPQPEGVSSIVVRTAISPASATTVLRNAVSAIDPALPLDQIRTMEELVSSSVGAPRFRTVLLTVFSMLAIAMAAVGIYGVTNYSVAQRTREFGVYLALGATASDVMRLVLRRSATLIVLGAGTGLLGAFGLTRLVAGFLFGVAALDPLTFGAATVFLFAIALFASYVPAKRASRVDPIAALRYE